MACCCRFSWVFVCFSHYDRVIRLPSVLEAELETLDHCDGCYAIAHVSLIEDASGCVCRVIFQRRELRTLPAPPVFSRSQQEAADALIPVPASYRDLRNVAVDHFSVHRIRRLFESGIYESDDLTTELRDKSNAFSSRVQRMLPALAVACRYRLNFGRRIAFRIKAGVILSTLEERASDTVGIF